jgi:penicillin-binding protein 1B
MTSFMEDVINRGTAAKVRARGLKGTLAGKTGTSRDGWFAGYTPNLVCAVWVGFDDGSQLGLTGANSALPIWADFMQVALAQHPEWEGDWDMPTGIQQVEINPRTGQLATPEDTEKRVELFINGTGPSQSSEPVEEVTPEELPSPSPSIEHPFEEVPVPTIAPTPTPRRAPDAGLEGTITLDIDPQTGLIAVETCPVIRAPEVLRTTVSSTQNNRARRRSPTRRRHSSALSHKEHKRRHKNHLCAFVPFCGPRAEVSVSIASEAA